MNLISLNIPEDTSQLPAWLEHHLLGMQLSGLAAELQVVHADGETPDLSLEDVLGDQRNAVLQSGLASLSTTSLTQLLIDPRLLLQLQAEILVAGGTYWDMPAGESHQDVAAMVTQSRTRLGELFADPSPLHDGPKSVAVSPSVDWYRRPAIVSLLTAACVLLGVFLIDRFVTLVPPGVEPPKLATAPVAGGWGWSHPDALPRNVTAQQYLRQLADGAGAWFKKRPTDRAALAKRIGEFRQGCSVVMLAQHDPLSADDRQWLVERCRLWAGKLDQHLSAAESPDTDLATVLAAADTTVNQLITALNQRAGEVSAG